MFIFPTSIFFYVYFSYDSVKQGIVGKIYWLLLYVKKQTKIIISSHPANILKNFMQTLIFFYYLLFVTIQQINLPQKKLSRRFLKVASSLRVLTRAEISWESSLNKSRIIFSRPNIGTYIQTLLFTYFHRLFF